MLEKSGNDSRRHSFAALLTERKRKAVLRAEAAHPATEQRRHEHREHRAGVDREVEEREELGALARLVPLVELRQ